MSKKKISIIVTAVVVVLAVVITAVILVAGNGNKKTLTTSVALTGVPTFAKTLKPIPGWRTVTSPEQTSSYQKTTKTNLIILTPSKGGSLSSSAGLCQATAQTGFLPAYQQGTGDFFLSKTGAYNQAQTGQSLLKQESTTFVNSTNGQVEFVTGSFTGTVTDSSTSTAKQIPSYTMVATRAFDSTYPNGSGAAPAVSSAPTTAPGGTKTTAPVATPTTAPTGSPSAGATGPYGTDPAKGVPVLSVVYTCYNKKASTAEFNSILAGLTVQL